MARWHNKIIIATLLSGHLINSRRVAAVLRKIQRNALVMLVCFCSFLHVPFFRRGPHTENIRGRHHLQRSNGIDTNTFTTKDAIEIAYAFLFYLSMYSAPPNRIPLHHFTRSCDSGRASTPSEAAHTHASTPSDYSERQLNLVRGAV